MRQSPSNYFIFTPRVYKPKENDFVIGIILVRTPDLFVVDINTNEAAVLPVTSFDIGCLPSYQAMNRLSVVYARVAGTDPWIQTELSCQTFNYSNKKSNFGLLKDGYIIRCSLGLCKKLQQSPLIDRFYQIVKGFHVRITRNGFVWYTTDTNNSMIAVKNVIYKYEVENDIDQLSDFYNTLMTKLEEQDIKQCDNNNEFIL